MYNLCGDDLKHFIQEVIQQPALIAGLSSGGVLATWLAAYAPKDVLAIISEDPPIFSSIWPRIQNEKLMTNNFKPEDFVFHCSGKSGCAPQSSVCPAPAIHG
jgi:pimeloyl-ACP methyl ester carboxylesterase